MQNIPPTESPDEHEVSIIDLDTGEKKRSNVASALQRSLHFFLQTKRKLLGIAIAGALFLLLFIVFPPSLFLPRLAATQKVQPPVTAPHQGSAVELTYAANKVIYINTLDGSVNALQATSGKQLWHYHPAFPAGRPLNVVQDTVYFTAQNKQKSFIYALDASNGKLRWRWQLPDVRFSLMNVTADALYFMGPDGTIYSLRAQDGSQQWHYKSSPHTWLAVSDGIVYLTNLDRTTLSALQTSTGKLLWSKQGEGAIWLMATTPDIAYVQLNDTTFSAIKTSNGRLLWQYTGIEQGGSFVLEQNTLYLTTRNGAVVALKADDGSLRWQYKEMYPLWGSLVAASQTLYFNTLEGSIYALRASDGKLLWQTRLANQSSVFAPPISGQVYTENTAQCYIATNDGNTYVFQASTGKLLWQYHTGLILPARRDEAAIEVQPAVYIIQHDNTFIALGLQNGALLWHYNKALQEPPLLEQGMLYVSAQDGTMSALNARTGSSYWHVVIPN